MENRKVVLAERPTAMVGPSTTRVESSPAPTIGPDEALIKVGLLSIEARRDGDGWVLSGQKYWNSGIDESAAVLVVARDGEPDERGRSPLSLFVVPTDAGDVVGDYDTADIAATDLSPWPAAEGLGAAPRSTTQRNVSSVESSRITSPSRAHVGLFNAFNRCGLLSATVATSPARVTTT